MTRGNSSIEWLWLHQVYLAIRNHVGTRKDADPWLAEQIHRGRIRWTCRTPSVVDAQGFWAPNSEGKYEVKVDFEEDTATRMVIACAEATGPGSAFTLGPSLVTLTGVKVARTDIETALGVAIESESAVFIRFLRSAFAGLLPSFFRGGGREVQASTRGELQWPWKANPSLYGKGGREVKRVQDLLEKHLEPRMQDLSIRKMLEELEKREIRDVGDTSLKRALGRSKV